MPAAATATYIVSCRLRLPPPQSYASRCRRSPSTKPTHMPAS
jgi:hypothetical protein